VKLNPRSSTAIRALGSCLLSGAALAQPTADAAWTYRVERGDDLYTLAQRYLAPGIGWERLQRLNQVQNPRTLEPGRRLRVPVTWLRAEASVATVAFVTGRASVERAGGGAASDVAVGLALRAGDTLATGADADVTVRLADGTRLLVSGGSRVRIESLLVLGRSGVAQTRLRVEQGEADSRVNPARTVGTRYEIRTPALTLGVRGTDFRVRVDRDRASTAAEVSAGRVGASPSGARAGERRIDAGFGLVADARGTIGAPRPLLAAPDLTALNARLDRTPIVLSWPALAGAVGYRAQVYADGAPDGRLLDGSFDAPAARWADLPDGRYVLHVRGRDAAGLEGLGSQTGFTVKARPVAPFMRQPRAQATLSGEQVELAWTRAPAAQRYRLQLDADATFTRPRIDRDDLDTDRLVVALPAGRYHWRLATITAAGEQGPFGDAASFELQPPPVQPPAPPGTLAPPESTGNQLTIRWPARGPAASYDVQVASDSSFGVVLIERRVQQPELTFDALPAGRYYVRVRTIDPDAGAGPYGEAQAFEVPRNLWWWLVPGVAVLLLLL